MKKYAASTAVLQAHRSGFGAVRLASEGAWMSEAFLTEARRLPDARRLRLTWSDGHCSEYPYDYLRGYCPCAMCQGHAALEIKFQPPRVPVTIDTLEPVGNYGLSIVFSDGHGTGIYRFDFLRQIDPDPDGTGAAGKALNPPADQRAD
jgi:DUF971 family protein